MAKEFINNQNGSVNTTALVAVEPELERKAQLLKDKINEAEVGKERFFGLIDNVFSSNGKSYRVLKKMKKAGLDSYVELLSGVDYKELESMIDESPEVVLGKIQPVVERLNKFFANVNNAMISVANADRIGRRKADYVKAYNAAYIKDVVDEQVANLEITESVAVDLVNNKGIDNRNLAKDEVKEYAQWVLSTCEEYKDVLQRAKEESKQKKLYVKVLDKFPRIKTAIIAVMIAAGTALGIAQVKTSSDLKEARAVILALQGEVDRVNNLNDWKNNRLAQLHDLLKEYENELQDYKNEANLNEKYAREIRLKQEKIDTLFKENEALHESLDELNRSQQDNLNSLDYYKGLYQLYKSKYLNAIENGEDGIADEYKEKYEEAVSNLDEARNKIAANEAEITSLNSQLSQLDADLALETAEKEAAEAAKQEALAAKAEADAQLAQALANQTSNEALKKALEAAQAKAKEEESAREVAEAREQEKATKLAAAQNKLKEAQQASKEAQAEAEAAQKAANEAQQKAEDALAEQKTAQKAANDARQRAKQAESELDAAIARAEQAEAKAAKAEASLREHMATEHSTSNNSNYSQTSGTGTTGNNSASQVSDEDKKDQYSHTDEQHNQEEENGDIEDANLGGRSR